MIVRQLTLPTIGGAVVPCGNRNLLMMTHCRAAGSDLRLK